MTPKEYLNEIVVPTLQEFEHNRLSRRHAYLACIAIYHIKDHLKAAGEKDIEATMRASGSQAFDLVRSICNGSKHFSTDGSHEIQFRAGTDYGRPPAFAGVMVCGLSYFGDTKGGREVHHDGQRFDIYRACYEVVQLYEKNYSPHFVQN